MTKLKKSLPLLLLLGIVGFAAWWIIAGRMMPRPDPIMQHVTAVEQVWKELPDSTEVQRQIKTCVKKLAGTDEPERMKAVRQLQKMRASAEPGIPALILTLKSRFPLTYYSGGIGTPWDEVPPAARDALVSISSAATPSLTQALQSPDPLTRVLAASALWRIDKRAEIVVPILFAVYYDQKAHEQDDRVRLECNHALAEIGRTDPEAVLPRLIKDFEAQDSNVYWPVSCLMSDIGPAAKKAIPVAMRILRENKDLYENDYLRVRSAGMVLRAVGKEAVPSLIAALGDQDQQIREWTTWVFVGMGPEAVAAVPALRTATQDRIPQIRNNATAALRNIEGD